jgi:formate-dependent phosphoribosylglycinamide formyltransferase (GAR transformylase)
MGLRPQIAHRLAERGIPFVVWHDKRVRRSVDGCSLVIESVPFPKSAQPTMRLLEQLFAASQTFSHVIAGTEASVVAASFARERFGSRATDHGMIVRCHDKRLMKAHLRNRGIPIIPYVDPLEEEITVSELIDRLGLPVVVKATNLSGRQGMVLAHSENQLEQIWTGTRNRVCRQLVGTQSEFIADSKKVPVNPTKTQGDLIPNDTSQSETIANLRPFNDAAATSFLFERWVDVPEVSVESWIEKGQIQFSSITEYVEKTWVNLVPSRHSPAVHSKILELNRRVLEELNIEWGMTHVEYFVDEDRIYLGEIAWRPPGGYLMDLISLAYGFDAWDAFVNVQLGFPTHYSHTLVQAAAAVLFHPGAGLVRGISGIEKIQHNPNLQQFRLLCRVGQTLAPRARVSNAAAYAIFAAPEPESVLKSVEEARQALVFSA